MSSTPKTAIVTGAHGAIGQAIAEGLARHGFTVTMVGRDGRKLAAAAAAVAHASGNRSVNTAMADLGLATGIQRMAAGWQGPLHVLVNNAATTPQRRALTAEGLEAQFAVNVLGYVRMIRAFEGALAAGAPARVVNVASYWAGDLDLDDLQFESRPYDNDTAYRQSKQADRMLTAALASEWGDRGITINACHPGDVRSKLSQSLGYGGHESPTQGADTPVWLATSSEVAGQSGLYFASRAAQACRFAQDEAACMRLLDLCRQFG